MENTQYNTRLNYLDGLRGWASFVVLLSHLLQLWLINFPGDINFMETFKYYLLKTPLYLLIDGKRSVFIFFIISGIALSYKFFKDKNRKSLISMAQFRYFRLAIPVLFSSLFVYIVFSFGFNYKATIWVASINEPNLIYTITSSLYNTFFFYRAEDTCNPVLWTMSIELYASYIILAFLFFFGNTKFRYVVYISSLYLFYRNFLPTVYFPFLIGLILSDFFSRKELNRKHLNIFSLLLIVAFVFFYQKYIVNQSLLPFLENKVTRSHDLSDVISMTLLMICLLVSPFLKRLFSCRLSHFMGRISFSLYLVHLPIIAMTSSSDIYGVVVASQMNTAISLLILCSFAISLSLLCAYIFTLLIEEGLLIKVKQLIKMLGRRGFKYSRESNVPPVVKTI